MALPHFQHTLLISYVYRISYAVASLILELIEINLFARFFFCWQKQPALLSPLFQVFLCQYVYKLTICKVIDVLARSSISHSHCSRLSPSCNLGHPSILLYIFYFAARTVAIAVSPLLFSRLGLPCRSSLHSGIFIAVPFSSLPSILAVQPDSNYRGFFIQGWTFFC